MYATHFIPVEQVSSFTAKLDKLNRKLTRLGVPTDVIYVLHTSRTVSIQWDKRTVVRCMPITVRQEGESLKVDGWEFVAKYVYEDCMAEALAESAPDAVVPREYWAITTTQCGHCGHNRERRRMYLLRNQAGEHKLVGSTCIKSFLGLTDAAALLSVSWHNEIFGYVNDEHDPDAVRTSLAYQADTILAMAKAFSDIFGWTSSSKAYQEGGCSTAESVKNSLTTKGRIDFAKNENLVQAYRAAREEVGPTIEYLKGQSGSDEPYLFNLASLANSGLVPFRHLNLWISAVTVHYRLEREAKQADKKAERTADVEAGRQVIEGEILNIKEQSTQFGVVYKALVEAATGCRYWGTLPSAYEGDKGDTIRLRATVKPSDKDAGFGFYSRPHLMGG